jgi:hypothetical protein
MPSKKVNNTPMKDFKLEGLESLLDKVVGLIREGAINKINNAKELSAEIGLEILQEAKITKLTEAIHTGYKNVKLKKMIKNIASFLGSASSERLAYLYDEYKEQEIIDQIIFDVLDSSSSQQAEVIAHLVNAFADNDLTKEEFTELVYTTKQMNPAAFVKRVAFVDGSKGELLGEMTSYLSSQGIAYCLSVNTQEYLDQEARRTFRGFSASAPRVINNKYFVTPLGFKYIKFGIRPFQRNKKVES